MVVSFYPPSDESNQSNGNLNVRLVLRPTIPHLEFSQILTPTSANVKPAVRLELDRDMGKPVDVLEVDSHATSEQVSELQKILCHEMPDLWFCSLETNSEIGKLIGTTGEALQSYPSP